MRTESPIIQGKLKNDKVSKAGLCYCEMQPKKNPAKLKTRFPYIIIFQICT